MSNKILLFVQGRTRFEKIVCHIVPPPPYKYAMEFVLHSLELLKYGERAAFFLIGGKKRYERLFKLYPPKMIYQLKGRIVCAKNGDFESMKKVGSAVSYAWYEWVKGHNGVTNICWI